MTDKIKRRSKNDYINNADFYKALVEYKKACNEAEEAGEEYPVITNYIGKCIFDIANKLKYRYNFINYPFREDMVSDGIENGVMVVRNFDPEKSKNPFAYFTQVIYYAFVRRIQKEKKQLYIKHKVMENSVLHGDAVTQSEQGGSTEAGHIDLTTDYMNDFVSNYEESMEKKKKPKQTKGAIDKFYTDDDESKKQE